MTYLEFKNIVGDTKINETDFIGLLLRCEHIVEGLMVYKVKDLTPEGLEVFNKALALQIEYSYKNGLTEGRMQSQSIDGTSMSFVNSGKDLAKVNDIARQIIINAGLAVC